MRKKNPRCEIIMAVRNELPENLTRTVENAKRYCSQRDLIMVVLDGEQSCPVKEQANVRVILPYSEHRGPGAARHAGIEQSMADVIVLVDGHMDFPPDWLEKITTHLTEYPKDVTCTHMNSLTQDWKLAIPYRDYAGCYFALKTVQDGTGGKAYWALSGKWNQETKSSGEIPCVMGACYGFKRTWYSKIGEPLSILRGWGQDEEMLSLSSWLCGGRCWLLPVRCGHIYAAVHTRSKNTDGDDERHALINRYASVIALPMPDEQKKDLHRWLLQNSLRRTDIDDLLSEREEVISKYQNRLARNATRSWSDLEDLGFFKKISSESQSILPPVFSPVSSTVEQHPLGRVQPVSILRPGQCERCDVLGKLKRIDREWLKCSRCGHKQRSR
ncbi:MAG: glycosyltransferase [Smithella sp.]